MITKLPRLHKVLCPPTATIAEVLARIEGATPNLFQIVVGESRRVLGTITDGDLRRGMLKGATMADTVETCMRMTPILGRTGEDDANRILVGGRGSCPL